MSLEMELLQIDLKRLKRRLDGQTWLVDNNYKLREEIQRLNGVIDGLNESLHHVNVALVQSHGHADKLKRIAEIVLEGQVSVKYDK